MVEIYSWSTQPYSNTSYSPHATNLVCYGKLWCYHSGDILNFFVIACDKLWCYLTGHILILLSHLYLITAIILLKSTYMGPVEKRVRSWYQVANFGTVIAQCIFKSIYDWIYFWSGCASSFSKIFQLLLTKKQEINDTSIKKEILFISVLKPRMWLYCNKFCSA